MGIQNAKMLSPTMNSGTLPRHFLTHQFSKLRVDRTSAEVRRNFGLRKAMRRIMAEESITPRQLSFSDLNFLLSAVSAVYWKSWARVRRQSSQFARQRLTEATNRMLNFISAPHFHRKSWSICLMSFLILNKNIGGFNLW